MKKVSIKSILVLMVVALMVTSCKNDKKAATKSEENHAEMNHDEKKMEMTAEVGTAQAVLNDYFNLKNALVADDEAKAKEVGAVLIKSLGAFDVSKFTDAQALELNDIVKDAKEHAEHISESPIKHQREHFKVLSKDVIDMVAITGTSNKLYEQFCPMYDGGTAWLSMNEEVRNPYYGSKMLKCGKVQREIN